MEGAHRRSLSACKQVRIFFKVPAVCTCQSLSTWSLKEGDLDSNSSSTPCLRHLGPTAYPLWASVLKTVKRECSQDRPPPPMVTAAGNNHLGHLLPRASKAVRTAAPQGRQEGARPPTPADALRYWGEGGVRLTAAVGTPEAAWESPPPPWAAPRPRSVERPRRPHPGCL